MMTVDLPKKSALAQTILVLQSILAIVLGFLAVRYFTRGVLSRDEGGLLLFLIYGSLLALYLFAIYRFQYRLSFEITPEVLRAYTSQRRKLELRYENITEIKAEPARLLVRSSKGDVYIPKYLLADPAEFETYVRGRSGGIARAHKKSS